MLISLFHAQRSFLAASAFCLLTLMGLSSCQTKQASYKSDILGLQLTDVNGFTETITNPKHLKEVNIEDFAKPQPYKKIVVTFSEKKRSSNNSSKVLSYYPNGQLHEQLLVKNFQAFGKYHEWYPNGERKVIASLKGGVGDLTKDAKESWVFDGSFLAFYPNGTSKANLFFDNGKATEKATYFYPSGKIQRQEHFLSGQRHGSSETFSSSGKLIDKANYHNGNKHGVQISQQEEQSFKLEEFYRHGKLLQGTYYLQDSVVSKVEEGSGKRCTVTEGGILYEPIVNGLVSGVCELYNKENQIVKKESFKNGSKDGLEVLYYPSQAGQKKLSLNWKQKLLSGAVTSWYSDGNLESSYTLNDGVKEGESKAWYRSGNLMFHEEYREGKLINAEYYKNGKNKAVSSIEQGKGSAILFNEDNTLQSEIFYENGFPL